MGSYYNRLSVCTLNDGQNLILRDNNEILVPEKERDQMLGLAHAANHKGLEGMLNQLSVLAMDVPESAQNGSKMRTMHEAGKVKHSRVSGNKTYKAFQHTPRSHGPCRLL